MSSDFPCLSDPPVGEGARPSHTRQGELPLWSKVTREEALLNAKRLFGMYSRGLLGGSRMPEDSNPQLDRGSADNYHYFTLPMALNYQRNSYTLWAAAAMTYNDPATREVFSPAAVLRRTDQELRSALTSHKLAVQPNKQTAAWRKLCESFCAHFGGDLRNLFARTRSDVTEILAFVREQHRSEFPYLSGPKICNYWLFVMDKYTDASLRHKEALNVAPDTHVVQATIRLGLVSPEHRDSPTVQELVSQAWTELLTGADIRPIDMHTPLWLWSRAGFPPIGD